jgi:hypothetical protein
VDLLAGVDLLLLLLLLLLLPCSQARLLAESHSLRYGTISIRIRDKMSVSIFKHQI